MSQQKLLKRIIHILDSLKIDYMVTGSVSSSLQGEPRSTHDIDLVVDLTRDSASQLYDALPPSDYYVSEQAMQEALTQRTTFNLVDLVGGDKVDFWILTDEPFDQMRFARKQMAEVAEMHFAVSTPEDTILMKLRWSELSGGSQKQFIDALRVYEVQYGVLDFDYLNEWASRLNVDQLWQKLRAEAMPL
jgi:hypothetical protein